MPKQSLCFSLFLSICFSIPLTGTAQTVDIPDLNLRAAIAPQLGKPSDATITTTEMANLTYLPAPKSNISDLIGHQIAAAYETRSQAIYWDSRNEAGESVASGVYFYHLSAGRSGLSVPHRSDYSATRKMLILK